MNDEPQKPGGVLPAMMFHYDPQVLYSKQKKPLSSGFPDGDCKSVRCRAKNKRHPQAAFVGR
jgi:hypothetical protein